MERPYSIMLTAIQFLIQSFNSSTQLLRESYSEDLSNSVIDTEKGIIAMQNNLNQIIETSFKNRTLKIQAVQ